MCQMHIPLLPTSASSASDALTPAEPARAGSRFALPWLLLLVPKGPLPRKAPTNTVFASLVESTALGLRPVVLAAYNLAVLPARNAYTGHSVVLDTVHNVQSNYMH